MLFFVMKTTKNNFYEKSYREKISLLIFAMADFRIFDIEIFLPLQVFYPSDRARQDEQKTPYNLPSKGPLEFSRNF